MWVRARLCKLQKGCTRLATASDKVYQLLAHGRWFSTDTPAFSTTKTGRHDIAEILLKVEFKHQKSINQSFLVSIVNLTFALSHIHVACYKSSYAINLLLSFFLTEESAYNMRNRSVHGFQKLVN